MAYNETLKTQYEIMTEKNIQNGEYVPNIDSLVAEAPCEEMAKAWKEVDDLIERTKDSDFPFAFTFRAVYTHLKKDGSYTIYQHGFPEDWTVEQCEEKLLDWIERVEL